MRLAPAGELREPLPAHIGLGVSALVRGQRCEACEAHRARSCDASEVSLRGLQARPCEARGPPRPPDSVGVLRGRLRGRPCEASLTSECEAHHGTYSEASLTSDCEGEANSH